MQDRLLTPGAAFAALEDTWPPAARRHVAGWTIRDGRGGGKRVSAATSETPEARIEDAEAAMRADGGRPLFRIMPGAAGAADDAALAARGYAGVDPTLLRAAALSGLDAAADPQRHVIECAARLVAMERIWAGAGIGPARLAVMDRVAGPRCFLLARAGDTPAGVAFVACAGDVAMVHALEVAPSARRGGLGRKLTGAAAHWAARHGARHLALAVTEANAAANALYERLGLAVISRYHYRQHPG